MACLYYPQYDARTLGGLKYTGEHTRKHKRPRGVQCTLVPAEQERWRPQPAPGHSVAAAAAERWRAGCCSGGRRPLRESARASSCRRTTISHAVTSSAGDRGVRERQPNVLRWCAKFLYAMTPQPWGPAPRARRH